MKQNLHQVWEFIKYYFRSKTIYQIHSPFLYDFLSVTTDKEKLYYDFIQFEQVRNALLRDETILDMGDDPGAGSRLNIKDWRVQDVAKAALSSRQKCEWLYRTIAFLEPKIILELGTSLGISALYASAANPATQVYTIEGRAVIADCASKTFDQMGKNNITLNHGLFDEVLPELLPTIGEVNFVILDGNHRYEPTIKYAETILASSKPMAMLIDDIHWSAEMTAAWQKLKLMPEFNVALDFYDYGLILHRPEIEERIDISFIDYYKKPWKMGFWN